jgi:hypothetical protein
MRHSFASLQLQAGEPITYVSAQLGHRDSAIALRVYAHWLPDTTGRKGVDRSTRSPRARNPLHTRCTRPKDSPPPNRLIVENQLSNFAPDGRPTGVGKVVVGRLGDSYDN